MSRPLLALLAVGLLIVGWGEPDPKPGPSLVQAKRDPPEMFAPQVWVGADGGHLVSVGWAAEGHVLVFVSDPLSVTVLGPDGGEWRGGGR